MTNREIADHAAPTAEQMSRLPARARRAFTVYGVDTCRLAWTTNVVHGEGNYVVSMTTGLHWRAAAAAAAGWDAFARLLRDSAAHAQLERAARELDVRPDAAGAQRAARAAAGARAIADAAAGSADAAALRSIADAAHMVAALVARWEAEAR